MLKRNIVANYAGTAWNAAMSLAFVPLYVKYLGTESYGLVGVSAMLNAYMAFFTVGLSPMVGREVARFRGGSHSAESIRSLLRVVEILICGIGAVCITALWLSAPWIAGNWLKAESLSDASVAHALRVLSAVIGLRFLEGLYSSVLMGLQRQVTANILSSLAATLRGAGSLAVLVWWSPTIDAFFWWQGCVASLGTVALAVSTYAHLPRARASLALGRAALRDGWPFARGMLIGSLISIMLTQTDKLLLTRLLSLSEYGCYSLAVTAASSLSMITIPVHSAFYPRLTELHARKHFHEFSREFHRAAQVVAVSAGATGVALSLLPELFLYAWTRDMKLSTDLRVTLAVLAMGYVLRALIAMPFAAQIASGRTRLSNCIGALSVVVAVPALIVAVPAYGIVGAACVWLLVNTAYFSVFVPLLARQINLFRYRSWLVNDVVVPLTAAVCACQAVRLVFEPEHLTPTRAASVVAGCITASICAAAFAARDVRHAIVRQTRSLLVRSG